MNHWTAVGVIALAIGLAVVPFMRERELKLTEGAEVQSRTVDADLYFAVGHVGGSEERLRWATLLDELDEPSIREPYAEQSGDLVPRQGPLAVRVLWPGGDGSWLVRVEVQEISVWLVARRFGDSTSPPHEVIGRPLRFGEWHEIVDAIAEADLVTVPPALGSGTWLLEVLTPNGHRAYSLGFADERRAAIAHRLFELSGLAGAG